MRPVFIGSEIYRIPVFQPPHPLAVPRAMLAYDLCVALGWLDEGQYCESPRAKVEELLKFHETAYIDALQRAEAELFLPADLRARYQIGARGNEIHPAVFRRPATSAGGAILAATLTAQGGVVYAPGVGNHHGRPGQASGFCFVNDIVLGILRWRELGVRRVAYIDLDAHHADGVEAAFEGDADVLTISVHEAGRWPGTGTHHNKEAGIWNFPVPEGFHDAELLFLMGEKILPLVQAHAPEAIMLLPGADALADDPMSRLALTNNGIWAALRQVMGMAPGLGSRLAVLGGGGYNPYTLARCWAGIWGILNGHQIPDQLPEAARLVLRGVQYFRAAGRNPPARWLEQMRDAPVQRVVRDEVKGLIK